MKSKRIILILAVIIFFTTGCSATYTINISDEKFAESLNLTTLSTADDYEFLKDYEWPKPINYQDTGYSEVPEKQEGLTYYNYENNSNNDLANITYKYDMTIKELKDSAIIHNCYNEVIANDYNNLVTLKTDNKFQCFSKYPPLEDVTVNIIVNKNVVDHNADRVEGNKYIWNIKPENAINKSIYLQYEKTHVSNQEESKNKINLIIVLSAIGGFVIVIFVIYRHKNRKYNSN